MYWIVFIIFSLSHDFISVGFSWLPLWYHARLLFIVWLQLPYFRGAERLFQAVLFRCKAINREARRESDAAISSGEGIQHLSPSNGGAFSERPIVTGVCEDIIFLLSRGEKNVVPSNGCFKMSWSLT